MIFVTFKIQTGEHDHFDYSWFKHYGLAHYEDSQSITDKDMIRDVYAIDYLDEEGAKIFENNFNEDTDTYEDDHNNWITVYKVQELSRQALNILTKLGVLYR
jgi:hypothetical protein